MKTSNRLLTCIITCIVSTAEIDAQCTSGVTPTLLTYDSTVTGVGSAPYVFTFPQFDASLGTLMNVRIQSVVTLYYTFSLENTEVSSRDVEHYLNRVDRITSSVLPSQINNSYTSDPFGPYTLAGNDGVTGTGPDYVYVSNAPILLNDTVVNRVQYNTAAFLGTGTINFNYRTIPGSTTYGGVVGSPIPPSITDIIKFNISYQYCPTLVLTSNLISLTATNAGSRSAMLKWNTSNESKAKSYELMVSNNGKSFRTAVIIPAGGNSLNNLGSYQYKYELSDPEQKLFFRVKQVTHDNKTELSSIRPVSWIEHARGLNFIPDPAGTFITINLPSVTGSTWNVDLYGSNGQLIQKQTVKSGMNEVLMLNSRLQKGVYVARAINPSSQEIISQKIFIQ